MLRLWWFVFVLLDQFLMYGLKETYLLYFNSSMDTILATIDLSVFVT